MSVFENNENGSWFVMTRYTNWKGERKQKCKRGFATKREAQEWEQKFHQQVGGDMDMTFNAWMNSSGHKDNLLAKLPTQIGIGYYHSGDAHYWLMLASY